jgi:hypothetical protein
MGAKEKRLLKNSLICDQKNTIRKIARASIQTTRKIQTRAPAMGASFFISSSVWPFGVKPGCKLFDILDPPLKIQMTLRVAGR